MYKVILIMLTAFALASCKKEQAKDHKKILETLRSDFTESSEVKVRFHTGDTISLPNLLRDEFLKLVKSEPELSDISSMPAEPIGFFTIENKTFDWHGNAIIIVKNEAEYLWSSPLMTLLLKADLQDMNKLKNDLEKVTLKDLENITLGQPAAYPGGTGVQTKKLEQTSGTD